MTATALQRSRCAGEDVGIPAGVRRPGSRGCPPDGMTDELIGATVDEADAFVGDLSPTTRRALLTLAGVLEHGTRSAMGSLSARWTRSTHARSWPDGVGPLGRGLQLLRDVVVVAHYEQPRVRTRVGYNLGSLDIADKRAERLESWLWRTSPRIAGCWSHRRHCPR